MLDVLITPQQLHDAQSDKLLIVDLSSSENFLQGHIPNAVHVAPSLIMAGTKPAPGKLPNEQQLTALMQSIGFTGKEHVVCYDDAGSSWAGRFIWLLDVLGHEHSSLLDGGLAAWQKAGFDVSTKVKPVTVSDYQAKITNTDVLADKQEITDNLDNPNATVWDVRSLEEYTGVKVLAERGGHIPNAVHLEWTRMHGDDGKLADKQTLQNLLASHGFEGDKTIYTHCQSHRRSGLSYFVGKKLFNLNIKAYPGSWSEWGNDANLPVEK